MNTVELIGWYGGDKAIARAAWTSTQIDVESKSEERIRDLIVNKLWNNGSGKPHRSPFERGLVEFNVTCDVASHIHIIKHRHANVNGECLDGDTLITFGYGRNVTKKKVKDLYQSWTHGRYNQKSEKDAEYARKRIMGMKLRVMNERTGKLETSNIKDIWKTEEKDVYKITLRNSKEIICSDNHPIFTKSEGYKSINDGLSIGDLVACNGVNTEVSGKPWTFPEFFNNSEDFTRKEFAKTKGIKYELCKKWGYVFDIEFKEDKRLSRKIGSSKMVYYSDIVSIDYIGKRECYDIEVEGEFKNFIANGIVTHNSARYKELKEDKYYIPEDWKNIRKNEDTIFDSGEYISKDWYDTLEAYTALGNNLYHQCVSDLTSVLGRKRAKESARFFKTYNSQITLSVMMNMSCFHNFYNLRSDSAAQLEIREIAENMLECIRDIEGDPFKYTIEAFNFKEKGV